MLQQRLSITLTCGCLVWLLATSAHAAEEPRPEVIARVQVHGNQRVPTETILALLNTRPGNFYSEDVLEDDVQNLVNQGDFRDIRVHIPPTTADGKLEINIHVHEFPNVIAEVQLKQAPHVKMEEIDALAIIRKGEALCPWKNQKAQLAIVEHLKAQGRVFAHVELAEGLEPADTRVIFNVTEGPLVRVRKVTYAGHKESDPNTILDRAMPAELDPRRLATMPYSSALVESAARHLEACYRDNGFLDANVTRELLFSDDYESVDVVFRIQEGLRTELDKRAISDLPSFRSYHPNGDTVPCVVIEPKR